MITKIDPSKPLPKLKMHVSTKASRSLHNIREGHFGISDDMGLGA